MPAFGRRRKGPGRALRSEFGPVQTGPAALLVIDEASTMPGPDLADLIAYARARDGKVILAGDTGQLQAVANGGGMSLLAAALGYVRLAEPVRFRHDWEQQASLRLHDGATTVLAEYDQHGRIAGGEPEQMMDAAAAAYVALADGTDTLLMAADHALRRELCRRIRDDLIALGAVAAGPAVRIADGAQASAGDLITCTRNDHSVEAGEPGRALANGDLLRVEAVTAGGLVVRRALDADPATGQRRWTDRTFLYSLFGDCRARVRGHRSRRAGPDRAHRPGGDHRDTAASPATRPGGCGAPCAAPNWPAWTPGRFLPTPSPNGTWPEPATYPASSMPGSGTGSAAPSARPAGRTSAACPTAGCCTCATPTRRNRLGTPVRG
jgi:hypothetical protein